MKLKTSFTAFGEQYNMTLDTENIDRNHKDENYGYWTVERDGRFFEVNIWKDDDGRFTRRGKVYAFADRGAFEQAGDADEETDITLEQLRSIWMRLGVTLYGTAEEIGQLLSEQDDEALVRILDEQRYEMDGDSYIPDCSVEEYNDTYGTDYETGDYEFCL